MKDFRLQGGMCPSVSSLIRLYEAVGRKWEAISDAAYERIRRQEEIPETAATVTIQWDGVMLPLAEDAIEKQGLWGCHLERGCLWVDHPVDGGWPSSADQSSRQNAGRREGQAQAIDDSRSRSSS